MIGACLGGLMGGLVGGFFQMKCYGVATPAIVTIPQYLEEGKSAKLFIYFHHVRGNSCFNPLLLLM